MNVNYTAILKLEVSKLSRPLLVLSDLHLGLELNSPRELDIVAKLEDFSKTHIVILNGDIFELWKFGSFGWSSEDVFRKHLAILDAYPSLRKILDLDTVHFIHGNHDWELCQFHTSTPIYREVHLVSGNLVRCIITHGNDADNYNNLTMDKRNESLLYAFFDYVTNLVYKRIGWGLKQDKAISDIVFAASSRDTLYLRYATKLPAESIILGHTHRHGVTYLSGDKTYYNSGSGMEQLQGIRFYQDQYTLFTAPLLTR